MASCHAIPYRKFLHDYVPCDFVHVLLGDDEPCKIVGKVKIQLKLKSGNQWLLKVVRHILSLRRNVISNGKLGSEG